MLVFGSCTGQNVANDAQKVVGIWTTEDGTKWVINSNGTGTRGTDNFIYGVNAAGELYVSLDSQGSTSGKYYISPDGKRLIIRADRTYFLQK